MIVSLAYDPENNRIVGVGRTDPPYQADVRFFIKEGEEAFGLPFEKLAGLISVQVDSDGKAINTEERPEYSPPETQEIPDWLRRAK